VKLKPEACTLVRPEHNLCMYSRLSMKQMFFLEVPGEARTIGHALPSVSIFAKREFNLATGACPIAFDVLNVGLSYRFRRS